jgi:SAM-dependent methyltransferase
VRVSAFARSAVVRDYAGPLFSNHDIVPIRSLRTLIALAAVCGCVSMAHAQLRKLPDAPYVPTPQPIVDAMLQLAHVGPADVVYDLGSGDGRIPITAAERFGARGVGVEIDPFMVTQAEGNRARSPARDRVRFVTGDLFEADLSEATVVTLFLFPKVNARLVPKLRRELRPGSRIVAHHFDLGPEWPADEAREVNGLMIYLWVIR